ncbi:glutamate-5-semialdehyde dehydrogenase [Coriobacterium glomerans PW2]|uniref:Gamma-glutamyl phosphate reductase n=1 Tax=Coriobacterium glomerans (strain ATCC 49209 / DSM 20642 / JCM 10262 / PW2) TaxID=700015 RepID=F2N7G8_CORGP|nr:glutamate-5-semialdehyde dehydrogenase [Coriobacterium glomerans]AEB06784.1 glutamate-5-semialdehyde dehydrogenase [Coriobacterium glomerans PW2]
MDDEITRRVRVLAVGAKRASRALGLAADARRVAAVRLMAACLRESQAHILAANAQDMQAARAAGTPEGLLDRLALTPARVEDMAAGLERLADLPDPCGRVLERRGLDSGIELERVSVPLGLVAMVFEARPNVTSDAAGICIRAGNACILRAGALARRSSAVIAHALASAVERSGFDRAAVSIIESSDREATAALMGLRGIVDVLIPRGGAGLIARCVRDAQVPVIETGTGNCHIYVHESADPERALAILLDAKTCRVGVCNAAESLLVDRSIARRFIPLALSALAAAGVLVHGDAETREAADALMAQDARLGLRFADATDEDWSREYLALEISVRVVSGLDEAIEHVNRYGTGHSEAIVAQDGLACERFLREVDAAAVYANASTRFTDGAMFGMGAEIGISTQKLHVRGPFGAEALTTWKYVLRGSGQVRG